MRQAATTTSDAPASCPPVPEEARRVLVLANPYSGSGPNRRRVEALVTALDDRGFETQLAWRPEQRRELLGDTDTTDGLRCLVAAGGDGSLADVINDMQALDLLDKVPLATLPVGTENLFAREFGYARSARPLVDAIERGQTRMVDLGAIVGPQRTTLFTLMASVGFDADVVHRMAAWRSGHDAGDTDHGDAKPAARRRVNRLSYLPRILSCVRQYGYPPVTIEVDGQRHTGSHLFIFNLPQYGGNLGIARHACGHDAKLDWVLFQKPGVLSLADYGWTVLRARHLGRPDVPHGQGASLRIYSECPIPLQADGDPAGFTPVSVEVRPCALRIIDAR
jgi:diacylglycerol kinase (ATP)